MRQIQSNKQATLRAWGTRYARQPCRALLGSLIKTIKLATFKTPLAIRKAYTGHALH